MESQRHRQGETDKQTDRQRITILSLAINKTQRVRKRFCYEGTKRLMCVCASVWEGEDTRLADRRWIDRKKK